MTRKTDDTRNVHLLTAHLFRESSGKMTGILVRLYGIGYLDQITDAVQDAFVAALLSAWLVGTL
ncbi:hypothetical protein [Chitinophaga sp. 212800010-3]|uniref:hypothetical protein n=1 Tax=unclassified Chitinophaga TaxID=2619133 RepID=UPI002DE5D591|nr:hypothetical protein [Chitinophaga sp. 212800010-3]